MSPQNNPACKGLMNLQLIITSINAIKDTIKPPSYQVPLGAVSNDWWIHAITFTKDLPLQMETLKQLCIHYTCIFHWCLSEQYCTGTECSLLLHVKIWDNIILHKNHCQIFSKTLGIDLQDLHETCLYPPEVFVQRRIRCLMKSCKACQKTFLLFSARLRYLQW